VSLPTSVEDEYKQGEEAATKARGRVAEQLTEAVVESRRTGSTDLVAQRVRSFISAVRENDPLALRGASMELAESAALLAVSLDLRQHDP
jgi:hypothetical protein